jgi:hypothetical protein
MTEGAWIRRVASLYLSLSLLLVKLCLFSLEVEIENNRNNLINKHSAESVEIKFIYYKSKM